MSLTMMIDYIENWLNVEQSKEQPDPAMVKALKEELDELYRGLE